jgi:hypothetical protein
MRFFNTQHEFQYTWDEVSTANWRKYCPWNDQSTHVIAVDTLSRSLDPQTNILRTERLITCKQSAPSWLKTALGRKEDTSMVYEISYVDPHERKVTMCSQNMTWSDILSVQETVIYRDGVLGKGGKMGTTIFEQRAKIIALCGGWQRIKNAVEEVSVARFKENAAKGREGFERVLRISREVFREEREKRASMGA